MVVLITGGCKNGKSNKAQDLAVSYSKKQKGKLYYVATMISTGAEDDERIKKHVESRKDLGFDTIELKYRIEDLVDVIRKDENPPAFLVDSLTALLANEMFRVDDKGNFYVDHDATGRVQKGLGILIDECQKSGASIVFVSDGIYSDSIIYGDETIEYQRGLALLEQLASKRADEVMEMTAGVKGNTEPLVDGGQAVNKKLIFGGAFQGKRAFAKSEFNIEDKEIYSFTADDTKVPAGYRAYEHAERLVRNILSAEESFNLLKEAETVIVDDITCGIVPMDATDRKAREETGRLMQMLGKDRSIYRVFCGEGVKIK
ncbi:adenosylcobinamide kinase /adenosylcobinamide-phosphate guanylyltransferase [Butyrivibrio sp. INlla18]|uniref:bifunctional adenosylcobinamide kinase/adenosylcobinamide-phosphate guanylyltransferase n=1 Tax=Butyrivibrio sp. INlla18 TaxID=1520806 RepID=UPI00087E54EB|nr:bifunctional adenosylcobinamide kinase/adenosylcobinamide-phosphate guanylyltransferase [Butyrivibrio sp. INlla18]SDA42277.1 adenosylcobinamide kinase /adenosylcobinamide-phosphate guanylyltransferase [Butyrivibrio sp. INlla18]